MACHNPWLTYKTNTKYLVENWTDSFKKLFWFHFICIQLNMENSASWIQHIWLRSSCVFICFRKIIPLEYCHYNSCNTTLRLQTLISFSSQKNSTYHQNNAYISKLILFISHSHWNRAFFYHRIYCLSTILSRSHRRIRRRRHLQMLSEKS